ncbi:MAG TPA: ABC transporter permease [Microvirga sp.]|jgi:peptide/nickel transport system permease protein|nr:ABC transporter permease [Microvirga sp.]
MRSVAIRFGQMLLVLWAVATLLFFMFRLMPGDPTLAYIDTTFTAEQQEALKRQFGLDRSILEQYLIYFGNILRGEFGTSFRVKRPVFEVIFDVLPNTLALTVVSITIAYLFGILAGAWLAWKRGSVAEAVGIPIVLTLRAAPEFWLGMVLLAIFAFGLGWFPSGGANSAGMTFNSTFDRLTSPDFLHHLVLPAATLALYLQGLPLLLMRSNMLDVLHEDYVMMARMKGLPEWRILLLHAARNALLPVVTAFALGLGASVGGNVVVETVFSWPGLGRVLVDAVASSDYPLAQGAFMFIAFILIVMNFVADLLYSVLDPRVSHG